MGRTPTTTEALSYLHKDSGCIWATDKLGYKSICLINCPFDKCLYENEKQVRCHIKQRDESIQEDRERGLTCFELSLKYHLSEMVINKILSGMSHEL